MIDWEKIINLSEVLGSILCIVGFFGLIIFNIRKIVHLYDKMENLIHNADETKNEIKTLREEVSKKLEEQNVSYEKQDNLLLSLARQTLLTEFTKILKDNEMSPNTFVVVGKLYEDYEADKGNGPIHDMWELVKNVSVKES